MRAQVAPSQTKLGRVATAKRMSRVITLFIQIILDIGWMRFRHPGGTLSVSEEAWNELYRRQAERFRRTAEELGGLLIKVGQFLSSRVDLLPKIFINELQALQDHVPSEPWERISPLLEEELGAPGERFRSFDSEPIASASLGQVYHAVLQDGTEVAVKIQRPQIEAIVDADLRALSWVVLLANRLTPFGRTFDLETVLREFRRTVAAELDYRRELENTERIRRELETFGGVVVPKTYPSHSTRKVLTMAFWRGIKINQLSELAAGGHHPREIAVLLIRMYLHMVFESGIYHADPHPGNLLIARDGRIVLLDYGMVGDLDIAHKRLIRRLFVAIAERNAVALVDSMEALGMIRPRANVVALKRMVRYMLDRYYAETLDQLAELDVVRLLRDFESLLRDDAVQVPGEFAFLGRALAILVGLATELDPQINLVDLFTPYARRFVTEDRGGVGGYALNRARRTIESWVDIPDRAISVLRQIESGSLQTQVEWENGPPQLRAIRQTLRHIANAVYVSGLAVSGALLFDAGHRDLSFVAWGLAGFLALAQLFRRRSSS